MSIMDNLERIGRARATGGDISTHPVYDGNKDIGPTSDQARDFLEAGGANAVESDPFPENASALSNTGPALTPDVKDLRGTKSQASYDVGANAFNTAQYGVPINAATLLMITNPSRLRVVITNRDAAAVVYVGSNPSTSIASGYPIAPGTTLTLATSAEVWAVSTVAGSAVATIEYLAL